MSETLRTIGNNRLVDGAKLDNAPDNINDELDLKVDKVVGKELSDNSYTDLDKAKLDIAEITTNKGANNGYAGLGADGKVPASQLPAYVDDVLEFPTLGDFPNPGETGKIYVALDTNLTYRWSGSTYVEIIGSIGTWTGPYDNGVTYERDDRVSYEGSSYIATTGTTGNLPTDTNFWGVLALKGEQGESATVDVGTTETGAAGTPAEVTNSGTVNAAILDFIVPEGEKGIDGDAATINVGTTTTLDPGELAVVTNSGTESEAVFNFSIPRGVPGISGGAGADGAFAYDYQTATEGQTVFTLTYTYTSGTNNLFIVVNGNKQVVTLDYEETNDTTVTFSSPGLTAGDRVEFLYLNVGNLTQAERDKLEGIEEGAEVNEVTLDGVETLTNKTITDIESDIHANLIHFAIKSTTSDLVKGQPIKIDSWDDGANVVKVSLASSSDITVGIVGASALQGVETGAVQTGEIRGLNTSAFAINDILWMTSTPGVLSSTMPESDGTPVAVIKRVHNNDGIIEVNMTKGYQGYSFSDYYKAWADILITNQEDSVDKTGFNREDFDTMPMIEFCENGASGIYRRFDRDGTHTEITGATTFGDGTTALADRTFVVRPDTDGGFTEYSYFHRGIKKIKTTTETIQTTVAEGLHIFTFKDEVLSADHDIHDAIVKDTILSIIYCDGAGKCPLFANERHGKDMPGIVHEMMHRTFGAQYEDGIDINGLVDGQETYTETTSGNAWDEDLPMHPLLQNTHPFIYREGTDGAWKWTTPDNRVAYSPSRDNTTDAQWNEYTGTTWQLTTSGSSTDYIINFYMLTNDGKYPIIKLIGQGAYSSRGDAQEAIETEKSNITLAGLPSPEFIFLYATIVRRNTDLERLADYSTYYDMRISKGGGGGGSSGTATYAENVNTNTTNFNNNLSSTDTTVQLALETLDDLVPIKGTITSTSGQTVFTVDEYKATRISIYINGLLQIITNDYDETDSTTITLTEGATENDLFSYIII